jgi:cullin 3
LEAAIVRTMKARGILSHQDLTLEVTKQIKLFKAVPRQIKKAINGLIDREFLKRSKNLRDYEYLA